MSIAQTLLPEFDHEMRTTRTLLERVPEANAAFKPHPKSFALSDLALHLVNLPYWMTMTLTRPEFDAAPREGFPERKFVSTAKLLEEFDANVRAAREALVAISDDELQQPWTLRAGEHVVFTMPRLQVLRFFVMNHLIHHRGQFTVYLRENDVPLPRVYGPTADAS